MTNRTVQHGMRVDNNLLNFINNEVLVNTGINTEQFWREFATAVNDLTPINRTLLEKRAILQKKISAWHLDHKSTKIDSAAYTAFLKEIGYIVPEKENFNIETTNIDAEIAMIPGPQLVVPLSNARYVINAANSRWGSFYNALYGTDAVEDKDPPSKGYDEKRGAKVISYAFEHLDNIAPLTQGGFADIKSYSISNQSLVVTFADGSFAHLEDKSHFKGYNGSSENPSSILLAVNGIHLDIQLDDNSQVKDIFLEAAISTVMDLEDSIAAVDADDKITAYRNWLGLMRGDLTETFTKNGKIINRYMNPDRHYKAPDGSSFVLSGRSLMLVRNVGHLMTNPAILLADGSEIPEGIMDAFISAAISLHDLKHTGQFQNSKTGSIYIVKPKMHGPEEVAFTNTLMGRVEQALELQPYTIKIGIMDEERRTTLNLKECIRAVSRRVAFINTGFLDRTGDEIHTSMEAGPMIRKNDMKSTKWFNAYEQWNVEKGLACGLSEKAQIGKGMWAMPDNMKHMLKDKVNHLKSGANCSWVPSPVAATLHSTHYHKVNVFSVHDKLKQLSNATLDDLLTIPINKGENWSEDDIQKELDNNAQGILGYVVRWINNGIGCSKVPDINNTELMEDRATLRISSQHVANWLHHGIVTKDQVMETMTRMAKVVDKQNANDPDYANMSNNLDDSIAFKAACELIFTGLEQPSGYTEPILHRRRLEKKAMQQQ